MKRMLVLGCALALLFFTSTNSHAILIGLDPVSQNAAAGSSVDVNLFISGLGDHTAPSLGAYDLNVNFDPAILAFNSVAFGDPLLGNQLDLFGFGNLSGSDNTISGKVNLYELSFDLAQELETLQPGSFVLARLTFDTLTVGTSPLDLSLNALGDASGDPLSAELHNGSINVNSTTPVPEPATILLLASGLGCGWVFGKKKEL